MVNSKHVEEWRLLPGFSRYEISCCGTIRRVVALRTRAKGSIVKCKYTDPDGYFRTTLINDLGKEEVRGVHRLVAIAFLGPQPRKEEFQVQHKDDNNQNNYYKNLKWGTVQANSDDAIINGKVPPCSGEDSGGAKLTWDQVVEIRRRYIPKVVTCRTLSEEFGTTPANIWAIVTYESWKV